MKEDPILAFARDFSGNDADIVAKVKAFIASPPTTNEVIGFYGSDDRTARSRIFLATVSLMDEQKKFYSTEDKYAFELLRQWEKDGVIDRDSLGAAASAVFRPWLMDKQLNDFVTEGLAPFVEPDNPDVLTPAGEAYREQVWTLYAQATQELEQHITSRGRVLLSIDATDGDTMFFALVAPAVAERWRDRGLADDPEYRSGVRSPLWDRFFDHMAYAARGLWVEDSYLYPGNGAECAPGVPLRNNAIPMAE